MGKGVRGVEGNFGGFVIDLVTLDGDDFMLELGDGGKGRDAWGIGGLEGEFMGIILDGEEESQVDMEDMIKVVGQVEGGIEEAATTVIYLAGQV